MEKSEATLDKVGSCAIANSGALQLTDVDGWVSRKGLLKHVFLASVCGWP
jgi:hypothetical protein